MIYNKVKQAAGVTVSASAVDTPVSTAITPTDPWNVMCKVVVSAATEATGITFKLKDSFDGGSTYYPVGSESQVSLVKKTAASASDVNATTNVITSTAHGFVSGDAVVYMAGSVAIGGLTTATTYYVLKLTADTFKLTTTQADALAGTNAIDLTTTGTGTQTFVQAVYEIRMIALDSSDLAQLPLWESVLVVANTGSGDSVTVSGVYWNDLPLA